MSLKRSAAFMDLLGHGSNEMPAASEVNSIASSSDSEEYDNSTFVVIQELQRLESTSSIPSEFIYTVEEPILSKVNLLAPSVSLSSIAERFQSLQIDSVDSIEIPVEQPQIVELTRETLVKRLRNLVLGSLRNFNGDDEVKNVNFQREKNSSQIFFQTSLPGNQTRKYALSYRK
jgi:hypothetical protein